MEHKACVLRHKHEHHVWHAVTPDGVESYICEGKKR